MNILHIVPSFYPAWRPGGPIEVIYRLCRSVAETGHQVRVLTTDSDGLDQVLNVETDKEVNLGNGLSVRYCHRISHEAVSPTLLQCLPSYVRWADIVHVSAVFSFPTLPALFFSRVYRKPVVWSPHGSLQRWRGSSNQGLKFIWEQGCVFLAPKQLCLHVTSDQEAKDSKKRLPGITTVIIPHGVEVPRQINRRPRKDIFQLGFLGRLDPIKGIENLLIACERLVSEKNFPLSLLIAGSGSSEYTQSLKQTIDTLDLSSHVTMLGHLSAQNKTQFFENVDILVMPSYSENFGLAIAEALAHGVPVIASTGTPWNRLEEIGCGLWVNHDSDTLARAIKAMHAMPLAGMGQRGREWMQREFSWNCVSENMIQTYQTLIPGGQ